MTANNGWPGKPGVPMNPEQDGWHVIQWNDNEPLLFVQYIAPKAIGWPETARWLMKYPNLIDQYKYLGPALLPHEAAALQKRVAELRRLVEILVENDPDDMAADAVTVLDVWRGEARAALGGKDE